MDIAALSEEIAKPTYSALTEAATVALSQLPPDNNDERQAIVDVLSAIATEVNANVEFERSIEFSDVLKAFGFRWEQLSIPNKEE